VADGEVVRTRGRGRWKGKAKEVEIEQEQVKEKDNTQDMELDPPAAAAAPHPPTAEPSGAANPGSESRVVVMIPPESLDQWEQTPEQEPPGHEIQPGEYYAHNTITLKDFEEYPPEFHSSTRTPLACKRMASLSHRVFALSPLPCYQYRRGSSHPRG